MKTFKEYIMNEGMLDNIMKYLIKNIGAVQKKYIEKQSNYGRELPDFIKKIKVVGDAKIKGYKWVTVTGKNTKEKICLINVKDPEISQYTLDEIIQYVKDEYKVTYQIAPLPELEQNDITPYVIVKIKVEK